MLVFGKFYVRTKMSDHLIIRSTNPEHLLVQIQRGNTRKRCEICSKLTIKALERHQWRSDWEIIETCHNYYEYKTDWNSRKL